MRVGFISDIHVNENDNIPEIIKEIALEEELDLIIIAGDLSNHYKKIPSILNRIINGTNIDIRFIPGNHDLYRQGGKSSKDAYERLLNNPYNLISNPIIGADFAIIGDTGWYDYSYNPNGYTDEELMRKTYRFMRWKDKTYFNWDGKSDKEVFEYFYERLEKQIDKYSDKNLTVVTHVVPFEKFVVYKDTPDWDYFSAFIGSEKYGDLFVNFRVKTAVFGHTHERYNETHKGIQCLCRPLGNHYELTGKDLTKEIKEALYIKNY